MLIRFTINIQSALFINVKKTLKHITKKLIITIRIKEDEKKRNIRNS